MRLKFRVIVKKAIYEVFASYLAVCAQECAEQQQLRPHGYSYSDKFSIALNSNSHLYYRKTVSSVVSHKVC